MRARAFRVGVYMHTHTHIYKHTYTHTHLVGVELDVELAEELFGVLVTLRIFLDEPVHPLVDRNTKCG